MENPISAYLLLDFNAVHRVMLKTKVALMLFLSLNICAMVFRNPRIVHNWDNSFDGMEKMKKVLLAYGNYHFDMELKNVLLSLIK